MTKKTLITVAVTVIFISNIYVFYLIYRKANQTTPATETPNYNEIIKSNIMHSLEGTDLNLNNPKVYWGSDTTYTFNFFDKFKGKCLVFRFSGNYCDECIESIIVEIKATMPDFANNNRIVLLCSDINPRLKDGYYGKKLLSYKSIDLGIPFEKSYNPFFFITDNNRISKLTFVPMRSQPDLTKNYLQFIKNKYFTN